MFDQLDKSIFSKRIKLIKKIGPLYRSTIFKDIKDPCVVSVGEAWHIFGSGGNVRDERWRILHAVSSNLEGPWSEIDPAELMGVTGDHVAAPGVICEGGVFHMFAQTEFMGPDGTVEYLTSRDGQKFELVSTALRSRSGTDEAGIYDPHPAIIHGRKYLAYSGSRRVGEDEAVGIMRPGLMQPDIFLAQSESSSWKGPWRRLGKILDHEAIRDHHNQLDHPEYEWGIEGPQLLVLPSGRVLLNATCFLPYGRFGTRQRVFFAVADKIGGPYTTLGPILSESFDEWESGENGHASGVIRDGILYLFYQARSMKEDDAASNDWKYGIAAFDVSGL